MATVKELYALSLTEISHRGFYARRIVNSDMYKELDQEYDNLGGIIIKAEEKDEQIARLIGYLRNLLVHCDPEGDQIGRKYAFMLEKSASKEQKMALQNYKFLYGGIEAFIDLCYRIQAENPERERYY